MSITQRDNKELYYPKDVEGSLDFIGFSFNGVTSVDLGISRVSDGSRYTEDMIPTFSDVSAKMPGSDYTLYWESFYNTRNWNLSIAYDHMTDAQMRLFRQTFNTKNIGKLTLAERTYQHTEVTKDTARLEGKVYYSYANGEFKIHEGSLEGNTFYEITTKPIYWIAKVQSPPQLKYICFDEDGQRIYKGEGTINLISYFPFGMADYENVTFPGTSGSGRTSGATYNFNLVDKGDLPFDWIFSAYTNRGMHLQKIQLKDAETNEILGQLNFNGGLKNLPEYFKDESLEKPKQGDDRYREDGNYKYYLYISSKTNLVELVLWNNVTKKFEHLGKLYNNCIVSGDFFKIPCDRNVYIETFYSTYESNVFTLTEDTEMQEGKKYYYKENGKYKRYEGTSFLPDVEYYEKSTIQDYPRGIDYIDYKCLYL